MFFVFVLLFWFFLMVFGICVKYFYLFFKLMGFCSFLFVKLELGFLILVKISFFYFIWMVLVVSGMMKVMMINIGMVLLLVLLLF